MALLAVSNLSSFARLVLLSPDAKHLLKEESWTSSESKDVSSQYAQKFESLLESPGLARQDISKIIALNGPGTFTGLRNSLSFSLGLSTSLKVPLFTLSAFDLYGKFYLPTRHQIARNLDLSQAISEKLEFIEVLSARETKIEMPRAGDRVLGLMDRPDWPSAVEIQTAIQKGLAQPSGNIEINYGLNPKISGKR